LVSVASDESGADLEATERLNGHTPLLEAAVENHIDIVKYLLESGANINAKSIMGNTSLHRIVLRGVMI